MADAVSTDTLLMPLLNSAYRGLRRELAEMGVSVLAERQDLALATDPTSGITPMEISDDSGPSFRPTAWRRTCSGSAPPARQPTYSRPWRNARAAAGC
jgi:hypothetical protein